VIFVEFFWGDFVFFFVCVCGEVCGEGGDLEVGGRRRRRDGYGSCDCAEIGEAAVGRSLAIWYAQGY
jgi:hypothetical protein